MRYFVRFAYNGTDFHGSQSQPNAVSVQQTLENAMTTILRCPVSLVFAGRTDAGVHATQMYAHFDCDGCPTGETLEKDLVLRLNSLLPSSIAVDAIFPVPYTTHARFSACARTYEYRITCAKDPFRPTLVTRVAPGLDFDAMNHAATLLLGQHDFASFCKVHTDVHTTLCTITRAEWIQVSPNEWTFVITANRFLRNMVRAIVGTLLDIGRHKISETTLQQILDLRNRCAAGQSAPAAGLYLVHIDYENRLQNE